MTSGSEKPLQVPQGKISRATRVSDLQAEIAVLVKERNRVRHELDEVRAECEQFRDTKALVEDNQQLKAENESMRAAVAGIDPNDYARLKREEAERMEADKTTWNEFLQKCELAKQSIPGFSQCVQAIGGLPTAWLRTIAGLPNSAEFVVYLGRHPQFRAYLGELKESAAIQRIQHAALELRQL
jgi:regulator of replication initiation timing